MSSDTEYILENIKKQHSYIDELDFYNIYKEFDIPCNKGYSEDSCYRGATDLWAQSQEVIELLKNMHSNLYKIYSTLNGKRSEYFGNINPKNEKICCISLKYWLYDKIVTKGLNEDEIIELFKGWENHIQKNVEYQPLQPCKFYNLNKDEIKRIKNIYALNTILQSTMENLENCNEKECKYKDYFEQGLIEFINSANKCSGDSMLEGYCAEFKDFLEICHKNNQNNGIKLFRVYFAPSVDNGSAIGLSSIFYYLYKFTPFGSSIRKGKMKNIVNIEEEAHNSLLYTSDTEQIPFKNREYKVTYHNFSDT
ncbi:VIR protein [Plasmodium vivax]|uniref:VIR protein n=1 Tax=Plasmodium vivax TaxID=5855 RepID=A0A1G4E2G9_PLAVI|nr:VIR protein [Plasmodium vivax]